jgi:hypothetical protein
MTIAIDGHVSATAAAGATVGANLTTTSGAPDKIVAIIGWKDTGIKTVSVSDVATLTWTARSQPKIVGAYKIQAFTATSAGDLVADTITATFSGATSGHLAIIAFGVSGAFNTSPFDSNVGLPTYISETGTFAATKTLISTNEAPELIYAAIMLTPTAAVSVGAGYTAIETIDATDFRFEAERIIKTAPQNELVANWTFANAAYSAFLYGDSVKQAGATLGFTSITKGAPQESADGVVADFGTGTIWTQPVVSVSGSTVTFDMSDGADETISETVKAAKDPIVGNTDGTNEYETS